MDRLRDLLGPALDALEAELSLEGRGRLTAATTILRLSGIERANLAKLGSSDPRVVADTDARERILREIGVL